ncbi:MAG: alpha/beta hydrolase [Clostridiales bacterium]|nr:alpha/beta hydrolase [Clostridiales bacterium]
MKRRYPIDEHLKLSLNGTTLDFRIRGTNEQNPVLLFLHGGPGVCDRHFVLEDQAPLTDVFTLACFDQRGSGKSYTREQAARHMDMETVLGDAVAAVDWLLARFRQEKLYLVGHSYGSYLGVLLCQRIPEKIAAYTGVGQLADGAENERISYEFVLDEAEKRGDRKALKDLARIGTPKNGYYASLDDLMVQRNLMTKYGGAAHGKKESLITSMVLPILRSPEYTLLDIARYANGAFYNLRELWKPVIGCDFIESAAKLSMPVFITQGRHDRNTPPELAKRWFDALDAPKKEWVWFEESAHSPIREEADRWNEVLRARVLGA